MLKLLEELGGGKVRIVGGKCEEERVGNVRGQNGGEREGRKGREM